MNDKSETNTTIASRSESQNDINIIPDPLPIEQKEIVLDNKIILDSVVLYNKLSSKFDKSLEKLNNDEKENTKMLLESSIFMLNGKKINKIANLEIYEKLEELYLNNNFITEICGLEHLKSLQVLNLKNNYIKEIKNIKHLSNLQILDLSDNEIEEFNCNEIPTQNLFYAYFFDNPFFNKISFLEYRSKIIQKCEKIERIDKLDVKDREKLILIDEGNLKLKFSLKCLNYINTHYESLKNEKSSKIKKINDSIQGDFDNVNNKNKYKEQGNEKINFSSTLHKKCQELGLSSFYVQYFPKPAQIEDEGDEKSIFFWQRREKISPKIMEKVLDVKSLNKVYLHQVPDPENKIVEPSKVFEGKIVVSNWFDTKDEMEKYIQKSALYFAPREYEGIGMSFLEAMAAGRCVISPNNPTMNEYIKDGQTGFLYNFKKPERINLKDVRKIQKQTADYIKEGFNKWENEKFKILDWLEVSPSENSNPELMDEKILIKKPEKKLFFKIYTTKKTVTYKLFNLFPVKINRHSH